ncbi:MAG: ATP-binding cassette domain-containing protein, partial [Flavobacteriales bacterium]
MLISKSLHKSYGKLQILKGIDLEIKQGEVVSIVGPSGAGKTTLLQILGTLENLDSGEVMIDGVN